MYSLLPLPLRPSCGKPNVLMLAMPEMCFANCYSSTLLDLIVRQAAFGCRPGEAK